MATSYCKSNHILVGLGGTGGKILKAFKMRMFEEFPNASDRDKQPVALLYVDSTDEMMGIGRPDFRVMGLDASFTNNEFLYIKDVDVVKILDNKRPKKQRLFAMLFLLPFPLLHKPLQFRKAYDFLPFHITRKYDRVEIPQNQFSFFFFSFFY